LFNGVLHDHRQVDGMASYTLEKPFSCTVLKTVLEQLRLSRHVPGGGYPGRETRWHATAVTFIRLISPASHRHR
jgi:hypothetical protein